MTAFNPSHPRKRRRHPSIPMALTKMEPELVSLPQELLDDVVGALDACDIVRLMMCNSSLKGRLQPVLYGDPSAHNRIMGWACRSGSIATIRLAVHHGASVDLIWDRTSTIGMAAKKHHGEAIICLLELGARVLRPGMTNVYERQDRLNQFRRMARQLCSPHVHLEESSALLRLLYTEAIDEADRKAGPHPDTALPLITLIMSRAGAPLSLIQQMFDAGADPNRPRSYGVRETLTPLSAAIIANSEGAFRLLLERGADICGTEVGYLPRKCLHIPIFAAARTMAVTSHGRAMMDLCLENGADINTRVAVMSVVHTDGVPPCPGRTKYWAKHYTYATPLLIFLDSLESFKPTSRQNPADDLVYLLERGAKPPVDNPKEVLEMGSEWRWRGYRGIETLLTFGTGQIDSRPRQRFGRTCLASPTCIDFLVDKWGLKKLKDPGFAEIIRLLIRHGIARGHIARLLLKYDNDTSNPRHWPVKKQLQLNAGRDALVTILLEPSTPVDDLDDVLAIFIRTKGKSYKSSRPLAGSTYAIIERLINAGADINGKTPHGQPDGSTVLRHLCADVNERERIHTYSYYDNPYPSPWLTEEFLPFLIKKGADLTISTAEGGNTALEALLADVDQFPSEVSKDNVKNLANFLLQAQAEVPGPHKVTIARR